MTITDLVAPEAVLPALKVNSKKQALQELAARAASLTGQNERAIFEVLLQREKLGTTAVGYGVAIPHGKLPKLEKLFGLFARLERPIDFEAMDGQPVDLVFLLLAPEGAGADHLKALARIARLLRDQDVAKKLRASRVSVNADGLQFVAPCVGDRGFARIRQHDRLAARGMQREQFQARREVRRLREKPRHVLGTDLLHIGELALAQGRQRLGGDGISFVHNIHVSHGLDSFKRPSGRVRY